MSKGSPENMSTTKNMSTTGAALPFQPNQSQLHGMPRFARNDVPSYLFRVYGPKSAGETTISHIIPPASSCDEEKRQDIFRLQPSEAARRLNDHLRWSPSHESECNLMSWTSSLLFALQYGLYRHHTDYDKPDLSSISLLVLDTPDFPKGTFIKDLEIVECFAPHMAECGGDDLENFIQLRTSNKGYYFGEYLTQGNLDISSRCAVTNMKRLVERGLFELEPKLADQKSWCKLAGRVICLRESFESRQDAPPTTYAEVYKAINIAEACFGHRWSFPVATLSLALKRRKSNDPVIVDVMADVFGGKYQLSRWYFLKL